MSEFLQMWFEKLDCVSHSERRKVCALGIATLIPTELGLVSSVESIMIRLTSETLTQNTSSNY